MNDKLKRNIYGGGGNNTLNTLDLQLFGSVSNPYTFTLDGDYNVRSTIEQDLVDLSYYARDNIENFDTITEIPQEHLDYLNSGLYASNMRSMFLHCSDLITILRLNIDTSNVEDMSFMFGYCNSLTSLNLSNFDTSKVTDMNNMFSYCDSLTSLNLSNWDTSKVTNMRNIFSDCESLTSLDLSNFDTSNVTNMRYMFSDCRSLITITGIIDMKSCISYTDMFSFCSELTEVKIKNPPAGFDGAGLTPSQYTIVS